MSSDRAENVSTLSVMQEIFQDRRSLPLPS